MSSNDELSDSAVNFDFDAELPRRRAMVACETCRRRKCRCDGSKPKCGICKSLRIECVYREPGPKLDIGDKMILDRLTHIEGLLQSGFSGLLAPLRSISPPLIPASLIASDDAVSTHTASTTASAMNSSFFPTPYSTTQTTSISTIPRIHSTATLNLLQWPVVQTLVPMGSERSLLLRLEMTRSPLELRTRPLDLSNAAQYIQTFFEKVNVWYACVDPATWHHSFERAMLSGCQTGSDSCLVLLVLALGQAAHSGSSMSRIPSDSIEPGIDYFATAWKIIPSLLMVNDTPATQCLVLAAAYLMFLVRPLEAWNLLHNASMKMQVIMSCRSPSARTEELVTRLSWNILMIESDLLAELDMPHSGISQFEEMMELPQRFDFDFPSSPYGFSPGTDNLWYFLAEIALRRLLNRVSHLLYATDYPNTFSLNHIVPVVNELELQLTQWYDNLPELLKFPRERLSENHHLGQIQTVLRFRYFACLTLIFRPYIIAVTTQESLMEEEGIQEGCRKCLDACIRQLEYVTSHREGHLAYLWQGALSLVSQTLLVMGASLCSHLEMILPPPDQVSMLVDEVLAEMQQMAHLAPSLMACTKLLCDAEMKRQRVSHI